MCVCSEKKNVGKEGKNNFSEMKRKILKRLASSIK